MGGTVEVTGLTKSFGRQNIWQDVTMTLPPGEITALLGPSGTGKSVFLKSVMGLIDPEAGSILIDGVDMVTAKESRRLALRKKFGVLFQDGALFGSMNVYDNVAFPLREHTRLSEAQIRDIVFEKLDLVGLLGTEHKLPGEISGGMKKRAGLARAMVTNPEIILIDEPDSGLDPVRTSNLAQLLVEVNTATDATMLVVTHNIELARTLPDNLGMLYRRELVMFGPREEFLLTDHPVVSQFMSGDPMGPIGMSEETDHGRNDPAGYDDYVAGPDGGTSVMTRHSGARAIEVLPRQLVPHSGAVRAGGMRHRERVTQGGSHLYVADDEDRHRVPPVPRPNPLTRALRATGDLFALGMDTVSLSFKRPFALKEAIEQFWFVVSISWLPALLVAIPFGAVIALQLGTLTVQIGAQSFTGAASVLAVVQQAAPIVTTLVIAGAGGAAICAEIGSRRIRDEIDALRVIGISPVQRLVVPRVLACMAAAALLNGLVSVVGVLGGYFFNVVVQGGTPGAYLASFTALAQIEDLWVGEIKAVIFGFLAGVIACYRGLNTAPGPKGVGDAVNQSVVITFLLLFFVNFVITTLYLQLFPGKGA
ncbi:ABC transport permease subunit [Nocardioides daedukensis]|uniref:ABC transport permease subunit n=1 Tax=Nocardioides daedukensis TaxID=634462 RepID=A0A7Y9S0F7_9ACTN|nr:ABC transport permease subunit [Nocardioides daedukensis]